MKPSVSLNKSRIAWTERGRGDPVLLLHPLLFTGSIFDSVAGRMAQHNHHVVCPDLPDHGESVATDHRLDMDAMTEAIQEFIVARSIERCHVVGLSVGGFIGLRLAARSPELVRSLTVMCSSAGVEDGWKRRRFIAMSWAATLFGVGAVAGRAARMMLGSTTLAGPRGVMLQSMVESAIRANPRRNLRHLVDAAINREAISIEERRAIDCPVLGIFGEEDRIRSEAEVREAVSVTRNWAIKGLPECGHLPVLEQPAATVALLLRFFGAGD